MNGGANTAVSEAQTTFFSFSGNGNPARPAALALAVRHRVQAGAHPSFPDREHFGRRELPRSEPQVFQDCVYQVGALSALARAAGAEIRYVKAHGALYNLACRDDAYARPLIAAAEFFGLPLLGLPGSRLQVLSMGRVPFIAEGFADRRYRPDGSLVPRILPGAYVADPEEALHQAERLLEEGKIRTLCVHGDNPRALDFVRALREGLRLRGHVIRAFL